MSMNLPKKTSLEWSFLGSCVVTRLEPNLPLFLPILLFGNARKLYLFCPKLCQHLPILPEIMPILKYEQNRSNDHCTVTRDVSI